MSRASVTRQKKHVTKDVVGLLLGEGVSMQNKNIVEKDVVGLLLGEVQVKNQFSLHRHRYVIFTEPTSTLEPS